MSNMMKNDSSQAMQNLVSAYVDDDADADDSMKMDTAISDDDELSDHSGTSKTSKSTEKLTDKVTSEKSETEELKEIEPEAKKAKLDRRVTATRATRLVSYGPDDQDGEGEDDEDEDAEHMNEEDMFSQFASSRGVVTYNGISMTSEEVTDSLNKTLRHSLSEDDVQIPPEPTGNCSMRLQAKISSLHEKVLHTGVDMNAIIEKKKEFRNPSIYDKLIEYCSIDEKGTNYPPELFNPTIWGEDSSYEVLAQIQKTEMDKREKERRDKKDRSLTVERLHGTKKPFAQPSNPSSPTADQKRKTKWDYGISSDSSTSGAAAGAAASLNIKTKSFP